MQLVANLHASPNPTPWALGFSYLGGLPVSMETLRARQ